MISILAHFFTALGAVILFASGLGVFRMPDVWNKMHAGTKATTLGSILFLVGMALFHPQWAPKLFLILVFIVLTNPVSSHALARSAHMDPSEKPDNLVMDDLAEKGGGE
ncbi:MAG TPA: monovalent cation/H(+) antiporter subunit G [Candidatus Sabulitectum sp.]|nr:monovalent cation/H(+) antiporter subunit G [Candidatus Sabulitectum sp.]HPJ28869.1 monovalent cation/H(+) antiporter subunit G [Candidatus Sabulitectum sp.]HPR22688.1 monovalent cation/H(+) antiporter subunit G [Candidatus Sabulitectum sp.]